MSKRVIILAGGKGTRLKPYTVALPKPLVPIGDQPILEIIIKQLVKNNFTHITISLNHLAEIIKAFVGDGSKWGINIDYSVEEKPLNTMAPLKLIKDLPEDFLVMNGDLLTDLNFSEFYDYHVNNKNIFTVSSYQREEMIDFGLLEIDEKEFLSGFKEKPVEVYDVSMGINMLNKKVLELIPDNQAYGFDNLMFDLLQLKMFPKIKKHKGYWLDIGRPDDYVQAINDFENNKIFFSELTSGN